MATRPPAHKGRGPERQASAKGGQVGEGRPLRTSFPASPPHTHTHTVAGPTPPGTPRRDQKPRQPPPSRQQRRGERGLGRVTALALQPKACDPGERTHEEMAKGERFLPRTSGSLS